jgi:hypothetical protein
LLQAEVLQRRSATKCRAKQKKSLKDYPFETKVQRHFTVSHALFKVTINPTAGQSKKAQPRQEHHRRRKEAHIELSRARIPVKSTIHWRTEALNDSIRRAGWAIGSAQPAPGGNWLPEYWGLREVRQRRQRRGVEVSRSVPWWE